MDELTKRFSELAQQYGPQVADAAMQAARTDAYSSLMSSLLWLVSAAALLIGARKAWAWAHTKDDYDNDLRYILFGVLAVLGSLCIVPGIWNWVDPWTWAAINHPELWLAKKAFHI